MNSLLHCFPNLSFSRSLETGRFLLMLLFLPGLYNHAPAQSVKRETGTSQIKWENNKTRDEAYREVEQLAMINAIINAFGQYVEQEASLTIESGRSRFNIIGTTKVKGEWLETLDKQIDEQTREVKGEYGTTQEIWITCTIKGRIREATPKANIKPSILSYPHKASKAASFKNGDSIYLYFQSPVDGYLSVFLDDGKNIHRILPYDSSSESHVPIIADKEYILFDKRNNYFGDLSIDELEVSTPLESELNTLHVIFSEKNFFKPGLRPSEKEKLYTIPRTVTRREFENWLADNKTTLTDFQDYQMNFEISGTP